MSAYFVVNVLEVLDREKLDRCRSGVVDVVARFGGKYRVLGASFELVEGGWHPTFPVMIEFRSMEAARGWYESYEYAELNVLRLDATRCDAVFFQSYEP